MIQGFVTYIETVLLPLGAWGVFLATLIEQVIAPIPSAFVQLGGGFFLVNTDSFWTAFPRILLVVSLPSATAVVIGSVLVYYLAYFIGKPFIDRWGRFLKVSWDDVVMLQEKFKDSKKDDLMLFIFRSVPAVPTVAVDILCGTVRYHLGKYVVITFVGTFIRATIFGIIGWRVGNVYVEYAEYIARVEKYLVIALVLALVVFVVLRTRSKKDL